MAKQAQTVKKEEVLDAFRRWGYFQAELDPLGYWQPSSHPELEAFEGNEAEEARKVYCGTIGVEFMHVPDPERRRWVQERMENGAPQVDPERILERLGQAGVYEQFLHGRYKGTKRFSLEGTTALIPLLDEVLERAAERGAAQAVIAMSHRGRLNVIAHIVNRPLGDIFAGFEDVDPRSVLGSGDVKYHLGATGTYQTADGRKINIHLVSNPSHLESVTPVAMGRARAKQVRFGEDEGWKKVLPITLHGDAGFAGQGIASETLNLADLRGFSVGGTVHVIVNNLIGFTTGPAELHSSRFASDAAKRLAIPIFHVNAEDPEAVVRVARLALEFRYEFRTDVVVDLIGFRRYGHSEVDDPSITQPALYKKIEEHPPLYQIYAGKAGLDFEKKIEAYRRELEKAAKKVEEKESRPALFKLPDYWADYTGGPYKPEYEVETGIEKEELRALGRKLASVPDGFNLHPKLGRLVEMREKMAAGERPVDFGMAEALAFATLLKQGLPVRLSGQDSRRGTFNQRHAVLFDYEKEEEYLPLQHVADKQARFEIYNTTLSEEAALGFEYGYSRDWPDGLVLWEAQFGDFMNNAQAIIDQFISAGEDKWGLLSGVVLLLPHGYEGQGPEHSSARLERFLQLAAEDNLQVCYPSTAAQYFHLLRRQALRKWRKPLVVFTPKSMLRHPAAASKLASFSRKRFLDVIPDPEFEDARRILVCSGKIGHELRQARNQREDDATAIVFLEQLYPFPDDEVAAELDRHPKARDIVWVQEEPANMGALSYVVPELERHARGRPVRSVKRSASASPATGSHKAHELEQNTLLTLAFTLRS